MKEYHLYMDKMYDEQSITRNCLTMTAWKRLRGNPIFSGTLEECNALIDCYFSPVKLRVSDAQQLTLGL